MPVVRPRHRRFAPRAPHDLRQAGHGDAVRNGPPVVPCRKPGQPRLGSGALSPLSLGPKARIGTSPARLSAGPPSRQQPFRGPPGIATTTARKRRNPPERRPPNPPARASRLHPGLRDGLNRTGRTTRTPAPFRAISRAWRQGCLPVNRSQIRLVFPMLAPLYPSSETWPSGRRHTPAKGADGEPSRGFESLRLRHLPS